LRDIIVVIIFFESFHKVFYLTLYRKDIMDTKIALTAIAIVTALALVVAPAMLDQPASAKKTTLCSSGPTAGTGPCPGNSGENNPNRCEETKAGQGQGGGEIKATTCED
jgi:hypothetical protein